MAHQADNSVIEAVVQLLLEHGLPEMANAVRLMLNEAMRIERSSVLEADPYERTDKRRGYANGFKPKTLNTRLGELELQIPQVRGGVEFYPSALERGVRSERALKCAIRRDVCAGRFYPEGDGSDARALWIGGVQHPSEPGHANAR